MPTAPESRRSSYFRIRCASALPLAITTAALAACHAVGVAAPEPKPLKTSDAPPVSRVLSDHLLVTWYGNPRTGRMGVLGRHKGTALADGLRKQAEEYARVSSKKVLPAYHLVAIIAQATPWRDGIANGSAGDGRARRRFVRTCIQQQTSMKVVIRAATSRSGP